MKTNAYLYPKHQYITKQYMTKKGNDSSCLFMSHYKTMLHKSKILTIC